jgi:hypothetical protein
MILEHQNIWQGTVRHGIGDGEDTDSAGRESIERQPKGV